MDADRLVWRCRWDRQVGQRLDHRLQVGRNFIGVRPCIPLGIGRHMPRGQHNRHHQRCGRERLLDQGRGDLLVQILQDAESADQDAHQARHRQDLHHQKEPVKETPAHGCGGLGLHTLAFRRFHHRD